MLFFFQKILKAQFSVKSFLLIMFPFLRRKEKKAPLIVSSLFVLDLMFLTVIFWVYNLLTIKWSNGKSMHFFFNVGVTSSIMWSGLGKRDKRPLDCQGIPRNHSHINCSLGHTDFIYHGDVGMNESGKLTCFIKDFKWQFLFFNLF